MSGAKQGFEEGGAKGFLLHHGEKIGLGVAVLAVVLLFWMGSGATSLTEQETPDKLLGLAQQAKSHIAAETWDEYLRPQRTPKYDLSQRVDDGRREVPADKYAISLFRARTSIQKMVRDDPELFPPGKPEVHVAIGPVIISGIDDPVPVDKLPVAKLDEEDIKKVEAAKPKREPARNNPPGFDGFLPPPGPDSLDFPDGGGAGPPEMESGLAAGQPKKLGPYLQSVITHEGWRPTGSAQGRPLNFNVVSVVAVVPFEKQWAEYERVFNEDVMGFNPQRDRPRLYRFETQKADVTDNPEAADDELVWTSDFDIKSIHDGSLLAGDTDHQRQIAQRYGALVPEIVELDYYDASVTMPIPPVLFRPREEFCLHSETPKQETSAEKVEEKGGKGADNLKDLLKNDRTRRSGGPPNGAFMPPGGMPPGGMPTPGGDPTLGGMPPGEFPSGEMPGGMPPGSGSSQVALPPPEVPYKLVRFFDLFAKPGRIYRYRVRVVYYDPNNPQESSSSTTNQPMVAGGSPTSDSDKKLANFMFLPKVAARIKAQEQADATYNASLTDSRLKKKTTFWRASDWSEISDAVTVPVPTPKVYAGSAVAARATTLGTFRFVRDEPSGEMVTSIWDPQYVAHVPAKKTVELGDVLNFTKRADILHPLDLSIRTIDEYAFDTDEVVLDIRGGDTLPSSDRKNPLTTPGEFLIVDESGNLVVRNEFDDAEMYRRRLFIDDSVQTTPTTTVPGGASNPTGVDGMFPPPPMGDPSGRRPRR